MILINDSSREVTFHIPRMSMICDAGCDAYQFILQHRLTKKVYLFTVRDFEISGRMYRFSLLLSEGMEEGEYSYYLAIWDGWESAHVDRDYVPRSVRYMRSKRILTCGDFALRSNGRLIVSGTEEGDGTSDDCAKGSLKVEMRVVASGLLQYAACGRCEPTAYRGGNESDEYMMFG